jgi:hypothetical protein
VPAEAKPIFGPDVIRLPVLGYALLDPGKSKRSKTREMGRGRFEKKGISTIMATQVVY